MFIHARAQRRQWLGTAAKPASCSISAGFVTVNAVLTYDAVPERKALLALAENHLTAWAKWAKSQPERLGYPHLSLIYKVMRRRAKRGASETVEFKHKGLTARGTETRSLRPSSVGEAPPRVAAADLAVASLDALPRQIIRIEYFNSDYPEEAKAAEAGLYVTMYRRLLTRAKLAVGRYLTAQAP
jgi:hypothetical protein